MKMDGLMEGEVYGYGSVGWPGDTNPEENRAGDHEWGKVKNKKQ